MKHEPVSVQVESNEAGEAQVSSNPQMDGIYQGDDSLSHLSFEATNRVPFVVKYLGLEEYYPFNEEVTQTAKELHKLLVEDDNMTLVGETKQDLEYLEAELNLSEDDAGVYKLKKLLMLAQIRDRQKQLESKKLSVLAQMEKML